MITAALGQNTGQVEEARHPLIPYDGLCSQLVVICKVNLLVSGSSVMSSGKPYQFALVVLVSKFSSCVQVCCISILVLLIWLCRTQNGASPQATQSIQIATKFSSRFTMTSTSLSTSHLSGAHVNMLWAILIGSFWREADLMGHIWSEIVLYSVAGSSLIQYFSPDPARQVRCFFEWVKNIILKLRCWQSRNQPLRIDPPSFVIVQVFW